MYYCTANILLYFAEVFVNVSALHFYATNIDPDNYVTTRHMFNVCLWFLPRR